MKALSCLIGLLLLSTLCAGSARYIGYWGCHPGGHTSTLPQLQTAITKGYNVIVFAFYLVNANGGLTVDPGAISPPTKSTVSSTAQFKYLISLFGGENGAAPSLTINADVWAQNMFSNFVALRNQYGYDGIDIDLENAWGGTGDQIVCGLRTFFKLMHNAGYIVSMAPQTTALTPEVPGYSTGSWNSYAPLADTGIIDYVDIVAVQLYNNAVPYNNPTTYAQTLINGFQVTGCPTCPGVTGFVKVPPCKIAFGYPSTQGAAPSGCPGLPGGCPYGSAMTNLYNGSPTLKSTSGVMTWSIEWDQSANWPFITAATGISFTSSCSYTSTASVSGPATATTRAPSTTGSTTRAPSTTGSTTGSTTRAPTTSTTGSSGAFSCTGRADGIYCVPGTNSYAYCPPTGSAYQSCAAGTVCVQNGFSVYCGWP